MRNAVLRLGGIGLDLSLAAGAFIGSYLLTLGYKPALIVPGIYEKTAAFVAITGIALYLFGVTRGSWRYVSIPDLVALIKAAVVAVATYTILAFLVSRADNVPRSVPVLTFFLLVGGLATARLTYRLVTEGNWLPFAGRRGSKSRNLVLLGLTPETESFIRNSRRLSNCPFSIAGVIDDVGPNSIRSLHGVRVYSGLNHLPALTERLRLRGTPITELVVAERHASRQRLSDLLELASSVGLKVTRVPDPTETASINSNALVEPKPIELGDLLGRPEIKADFQRMAHLIEGKTVLTTGAAGSIGSELCRQIATFNPRRLILADSSEYHTYLLDKEMRETFPGIDVVTLLVDVRDRKRVNGVFEEYEPEVVFHAAALKHVPLVEQNPLEAIKTNIFGTRNVADAALQHRSSTFVMISTDKAVNPTNVMGATKRAAESYCQSLDVTSEHTRFKTVRFGNVLGSNGSVVPRFQEQIAAGGPVTVTHPNIVRYFMTIPEAVRLVLHASAIALARKAERGRIMVLDMGKPVRIVDLAERMIQLAGYRPGSDIEIVYSGLRPGEKLYEELLDPSEAQDAKTESGFVIASPRVIDSALLLRTFEGLGRAIQNENVERSIELLTHVVPEYARTGPQDKSHSSGGSDRDRREPA